MGGLRAEILADEGLVHDHDEGRIGGVGRGEAASADQRDAHGGEVGGAGIGEFAVTLGRVDTNGVSPTVAVERSDGGRGGILNARNAAHILDQLPLERRLRFPA